MRHNAWLSKAASLGWQAVSTRATPHGEPLETHKNGDKSRANGLLVGRFLIGRISRKGVVKRGA